MMQNTRMIDTNILKLSSLLKENKNIMKYGKEVETSCPEFPTQLTPSPELWDTL